jgi:exopolysaccharide biosynthesis polyprenyl glycosylphosphotransferase
VTTTSSQLWQTTRGIQTTGYAATSALPASRTVSGLKWQSTYPLVLVVLDVTSITVAAVVALQVRFGGVSMPARGLLTSLISAAFPPLWVGVMAANRAYESRFLGTGSEEFRRVARAAVAFIATVATVCYAFKMELARGYVALALPLGTVLTLLARYGARRVLHFERQRGRCAYRTLVLGDRRHVAELITTIHREVRAGLHVVGACVSDSAEPICLSGVEVPVVASLVGVTEAARRHNVDAIAVATSPAVTGSTLRRLAWELEGSGIDLLLAPALTEVAGPRVSIRPVAGLPLLHLHEPEFTGARRVLKEMLDRTGAALLLVALSVSLAAVALIVRLTSPGPALFRQRRAGLRGHEFEVFKLRTMYEDAEARFADLEAQNERDGLLFKIENDPRITPLGKWLRRLSIDELPQLINVVRGDMALVGPRPLPVDPNSFAGDSSRRLLVKPGITGLWQVSGRSNLSWAETVRLDLYYVENWSLALDLSILCRTLSVVLLSRGAC